MTNSRDKVAIQVQSDDSPNYLPGSDIDLLLMNKNSSLQKVVDYYELYISAKREIKVTDEE